MNTLNLEYWYSALENLARIIAVEKDDLCRLDGVIGDGDHGASMDRGMRAMQQAISEQAPDDIGALLNKVGMTFVGSVGGVTGIIFGTFFMGLGKPVVGKQEVTLSDLVGMFSQALADIKKRGKVTEGDKSMIDALSPAAIALAEAATNGSSLQEALQEAAAAADQGKEATIQMQANVGRARYQGENAIGYPDAGATSTYLIVKTLADTFSSRVA